MAKKKQDRKGGTLLDVRERVDTPRLFRVLLHNDDYTTMDFVVEVLVSFFRKSEAEATQLMLQVHLKGKAVAGVYTRDVAETKVETVLQYARKNGHPLHLSVEPE